VVLFVCTWYLTYIFGFLGKGKTLNSVSISSSFLKIFKELSFFTEVKIKKITFALYFEINLNGKKRKKACYLGKINHSWLGR
jgi:hypothetical protein